ncbi:MAG: hypothetical protein MZV64_42575 [Ignavibacteriales bacterium]|nr:hypothetical protein [Ignavibacteriales bacterium]
MGVGAVIKLLDGFGVFRAANELPCRRSARSRRASCGSASTTTRAQGHRRRRDARSRRPASRPAYIGVGYIIGPELGALNFAGGLLAWGLFVPLLVYFLGPSTASTSILRRTAAASAGGVGRAGRRHLDQFIVRPIAVGGMLVGACYTLCQDAQEPHRAASSAASPT